MEVQRYDPDVEKVVQDANRSEIHRRTGISLSGVSRILSGKRNASSANLGSVALCLGVTMDGLHAYLTFLKLKAQGRGRRGKKVRVAA